MEDEESDLDLFLFFFFLEAGSSLSSSVSPLLLLSFKAFSFLMTFLVSKAIAFLAARFNETEALCASFSSADCWGRGEEEEDDDEPTEDDETTFEEEPGTANLEFDALGRFRFGPRPISH